jgi:hypothetical protein
VSLELGSETEFVCGPFGNFPQWQSFFRETHHSIDASRVVCLHYEIPLILCHKSLQGSGDIQVFQINVARTKVGKVKFGGLGAIGVALHALGRTASNERRQNGAGALHQSLIRIARAQSTDELTAFRADQGGVLVQDVVAAALPQQPRLDPVIAGCGEPFDNVNTPPASDVC